MGILINLTNILNYINTEKLNLHNKKNNEIQKQRKFII